MSSAFHMPSQCMQNTSSPCFHRAVGETLFSQAARCLGVIPASWFEVIDRSLNNLRSIRAEVTRSRPLSFATRFRSSATFSQAREKSRDWDFNRLGNSHQGFDRNDLFSAFDFPDVFGVEVNRFRKALLRKPCPLPIVADGSTDYFSMSDNRLPSFLHACHSPVNVGPRRP